RRPRLRPVLRQARHLLPLHRQALCQRARVPQAPAHPRGHRLRGPRQRPPHLRRRAPRPGSVRRALGRAHRGARPQVARPPPPPTRAPPRMGLPRPPPPYPAAARKPGYRYDASILQAESALTQVLDQPVPGRIFFEEVIRENLDIGRPDQVQLIFGRRVTRRTPGRFRTRILTAGVTPSLHVAYKRSRIKQYHKEGRALRTETTINDARDVGVGKRLPNLPALREIGFQANRRLLQVERLTHDCAIGADAFRAVTTPQVVDGQRVA